MQKILTYITGALLLSTLFFHPSCNKSILPEEDPIEKKIEIQLKVLQLNIWMEGTVVPDGLSGIVDIIDQIDPDIVLLCEIRNNNNIPFIPKLITRLDRKGKPYYFGDSKGDNGILSKYKLKDVEQRHSMTKASCEIEGQTFVVYSAHLDASHYECYLPRGYSGTTWKKLEGGPITDANYIYEANMVSSRDEAIDKFVADAQKEIIKGNIVIMGGDLNEPSHLDWQENTKNLWDHNGVVIDWYCSSRMIKSGYKDSYREIYPDPVRYPGFTFPSANKHVTDWQLAWAPEADERDRIDFIYYYPNPLLKLTDARIVGPSGTVYYGKTGPHDADDIFIEPKGIWPTDHKGNLATFTISLQPQAKKK
ncbi:endonuclease/exonuclease/phosphatase family protein [Proteiniphilum sp.]|uniref:endonuclease/exonuclease/phosphatase family protein n=1 Tax=Proteiniphilum sp. TaxID=1926877 RepID=UPI002B215257|nr:endonuclease/exonuclease/phosphatase family protein [Proteiniphilum sp.]MEA4917824.1 endonuclease/exonuclease/phosphatase family protein [Proteiniphilum sp.]